MDLKLKQLLKSADDYIGHFKDDKDLPLNYKEETISNVQALIESLRNASVSKQYTMWSLNSLAIYIGKLIKKKFPQFDFKILYEGDTLNEIQLANNSVKINLLSWVRKNYEDPSKDVSSKYKKMLESLSGS